MTSGIPVEDWIAHHARFAPQSEAAYDLASGRRFSYAAFDERITRAALWLARAFGVERGDRVAVLSMNDTDVFELQFACRRLGAVFLPLNWRLAVPELEFICKDAAPVVLIHGQEFADAALQVARLAAVPHTADMANGKPSAYEAGLAAASGTLDPPALDLADIWTIMYTSGTTGRPKGAQITYQMCVFNGIQCAMTVGLTAATRNLVFLPTFHTGGLNVYANPTFHTGGCNVVMRSFDPGMFLKLLTDRELHEIGEAIIVAAWRVRACAADGIMLSTVDGVPFEQLISPLRNRRSASIPSSLGILISRIARSGGLRRMASSAAGPSA